ncbi:hypothetical protein [Mesomycoplasma molare]|uniref:Uncharacterized protein n=1 Tax=Mesomycoplasma molare TaxID=171288 RepID=A0ABY5TUH9_9BACT|nr:hypothetical protein [Mesomycoplasma molare]UWD34245.1 hypothetical protein NX772_00215 [Mesomycoplasma molare]
MTENKVAEEQKLEVEPKKAKQKVKKDNSWRKAKTSAGRTNRWLLGLFLGFSSAALTAGGIFFIYQYYVKTNSKNPSVEITNSIKNDKDEATKPSSDSQ